jgi:drug/metabolite transporter (DMT)-like permease
MEWQASGATPALPRRQGRLEPSPGQAYIPYMLIRTNLSNPGQPGVSRLYYLGPLLAVLAYAWAAIFIRWAREADPLAIAFYRMFFTTLVWGPFFWVGRGRKAAPKMTPRQKRLVVLAGLLLCFHFATWIPSLKYTTVASAVFLILTQPIMVALAAHFILGERLNRWNLAAMAFTVAGAVLIFGGDMPMGRSYLIGDGLALIGAMGAGGYLFVARLARPDRASTGAGVPLMRYLPPVYGIATLGLFVVCLVAGVDFGPYTKDTWLALLALALIPTVIGHSLFNWSLRYLPALPVNIAIVGEPIGASILAYFFFQEVPSLGLIVGSPLLILAVLFVFFRPPKTMR